MYVFVEPALIFRSRFGLLTFSKKQNVFISILNQSLT